MRLLPVAIVALALMLAGCGDDGEESEPPSDEELITEAAETWAEGWAADDSQIFCPVELYPRECFNISIDEGKPTRYQRVYLNTTVEEIRDIGHRQVTVTFSNGCKIQLRYTKESTWRVFNSGGHLAAGCEKIAGS